MKRWLIIIFMSLATIALIQNICEAQKTFVGTFKITVMLPSILEVNLPNTTEKNSKLPVLASLISEQDVKSNNLTDIINTEKIVNNQKILFQTVVVR